MTGCLGVSARTGPPPAGSAGFGGRGPGGEGRVTRACTIASSVLIGYPDLQAVPVAVAGGDAVGRGPAPGFLARHPSMIGPTGSGSNKA